MIKPQATIPKAPAIILEGQNDGLRWEKNPGLFFLTGVDGYKIPVSGMRETCVKIEAAVIMTPATGKVQSNSKTIKVVRIGTK
jgi:hypothetical protein